MASKPLPSPPPSSQSIIDGTSNTIILAFDLVGSQIPKLPSELADALNRSDVKTAIESVLTKFALAKQQTSTTTMTDQEAGQLAQALLTASGPKLADAMLDQLKKTPEYKKLEQSMNDLQDTLKTSPLGVWVDRNQMVLYVVGAGLALGGATALYVTKTGGPMVNLPMSQLTGKSVQFFKVGRFSMSGKALAFQPDTRTLGTALAGTAKWERLQVTLQLGVIATGTDVKEVNGQAIFKTQDIDVFVTGAAQPAKKTVNLGLSVGIKSGTLAGPLTIGVSAVVKDGKADQGQLNASLKTTKYGTFGVTGAAGSGEVKGMATWSISLP